MTDETKEPLHPRHGASPEAKLPVVTPPEPGFVREHCPKCEDGWVTTPVHVAGWTTLARLQCSTCRGTGRRIRSTHSAESAVDGESGPVTMVVDLGGPDWAARGDGCWHGDRGHPCALPDVAKLQADLAATRSALNRADCTQREGGELRHCPLAAQCWRCRAEAAEHYLAAAREELETTRGQLGSVSTALERERTARQAAEKRAAEAEVGAAVLRDALARKIVNRAAERTWCIHCRTETPQPHGGPLVPHQHAQHCILSSDAGKALLERLEKAERTAEAAEKARASAHQKRLESDAESNALVDERDALREKLATAERELDCANTALVNANVREEELLAQIETLTRDRSAAERTAAEARAQVETLTKERAEATREATLAVATLRAQVETLTKERDAERQATITARVSAAKAETAHRVQVQGLEERLALRTKERDALRAQVETLTTALEQAATNLESAADLLRTVEMWKAFGLKVAGELRRAIAEEGGQS